MSPAAGKVQPVDVARVLHGSVPPTVLLVRQRSMQLSPTPCMLWLQQSADPCVPHPRC